MKLEHGIHYIVTKGSNDETFRIGDHIWLLENGDVMVKEGQGWINGSVVTKELEEIEVQIDYEYAKRKLNKLQAEVNELKKSYGEGNLK